MISWSDRLSLRPLVLVFAVAALGLAVACGSPGTDDGSFPQIDGLKVRGAAEVYDPETLFEYINGAAESYLAYGFEELTVQSYEENGEVVLVVDVYQHRDRVNAFGIYCQERPADGPFVEVGTEGYHQPGVINFFKGRYYVKILSYRQLDDERKELVALAGRLADRLVGDTAFPRALDFLPQSDRIPHTERFIARDFLGHGFLHSAFVADYASNEGHSQAFLLVPDKAEAAREMIDAYRAFATGKSEVVTEADGTISFVDPYYRSNGTLRLAALGGTVFGSFGVDEQKFYSLTEEVRTAMEATDPPS
jgi:hypothetical protein